MSVHAFCFHVKYIPVIKLFSQVRKLFFFPEQICYGHESISGLSVELTDVHEEFFLWYVSPRLALQLLGKDTM